MPDVDSKGSKVVLGEGIDSDAGRPVGEQGDSGGQGPVSAEGGAFEGSSAVGPQPEVPIPAGEEGKGGQSGGGDGSRETASGMGWYVLRVASNREEQVCEALKRKVAIEHLDDRIGRILVPTQREKRMRGRVARVYDRKLYPGYVFIEMATEEDGSVPEDVWFMVKETMSVGDFIGSDGKPTAMKPHDVEKMLAVVEKSAEQPTLAGMAGMKKGDPIKVKEGPFENFEGEIDEVFPDKGQVRVIVTIFGRATPIDLEYWQVELT
ncbi:MAG: transcription termination/antitermination factor NusG [Phycisphaerae bacterium]|nr:transcription termination/antitermination factor NusG [Phycisphaerae bacterium]